MKRRLAILSIIPFLFSCSSFGGEYFKYVEEKLQNEGKGEYSFLQLYDNELNRFSVEFVYDLHFGLSLKIVEYDDQDIYIYPNEGEISKNYEKVTFNNDSYDSSELFPRGEYVLSHSFKYGKDNFSLLAADINYSLTLDKKDKPLFLDKDLIGKYHDEENKFSLEVNRSSKKNGMITSIILKEENKTYIGADFTYGNDQVEFNIKGDEDGEYIKNGSAALTYDMESEEYIFTVGSFDYVILKNKEDENEKGFFHTGFFKVFNEHLSIELVNYIGDSKAQLKLEELDEGGAMIIAFFDLLDNGETLKNTQELDGKLIFLKNNKYELKHTIVDDKDQVDLYKNEELLYQNLTIERDHE